jgi:hypothetical protein
MLASMRSRSASCLNTRAPFFFILSVSCSLSGFESCIPLACVVLPILARLQCKSVGSASPRRNFRGDLIRHVVVRHIISGERFIFHVSRMLTKRKLGIAVPCSEFYMIRVLGIQYSLVYPVTYDLARSGRMNARTGLSNMTQVLVYCFGLISFGPV